MSNLKIIGLPLHTPKIGPVIKRGIGILSGKSITAVALGGNAFMTGEIKASDFDGQRRIAFKTTETLAKLAVEQNLRLITHGNGPQVGALYNQKGDPLWERNKDTELLIGDWISDGLKSNLTELGVRIGSEVILTRVVVNPDDPAFKNPTKPIGDYYTFEEKEKLIQQKGWTFKKVKENERGWRRVVPSPKPIKIIEVEEIAAELEAGKIVIAAGGGGVPVVEQENGNPVGIDAVIDKDYASIFLILKLRELGIPISRFFIPTEADGTYLNYAKPDQIFLRALRVDPFRKHFDKKQFPPGQMGPKVEAAEVAAMAGIKIPGIMSLKQLGDLQAGTRVSLDYNPLSWLFRELIRWGIISPFEYFKKVVSF